MPTKKFYGYNCFLIMNIDFELLITILAMVGESALNAYLRKKSKTVP